MDSAIGLSTMPGALRYDQRLRRFPAYLQQLATENTGEYAASSRGNGPPMRSAH